MIRQPLEKKKIILGVTGSIAVYKSVDVASKLTQLGAEVQTILSNSAKRFVSPLTFQSVTGKRAFTDEDLWGNEAHILHVNMSKDADLFVVAPITANTIAKLAHGIADNLLTITALTIGSGENSIPTLIAPAMDARMFEHEVTQKNLDVLIQRGYKIIGPEKGRLASGLYAKGRMSEPKTIIDNIRYLLTREGPLRGTKIVVTAGGTREPIDPVRVITNLSSGKQGLAIVQSALDYGAEVTLISPELSQPIPTGANYHKAQTAEEMKTAVIEACQSADILIMAAAIADFRPKSKKTQKIKKHDSELVIALEPTTDILRQVAKQKTETGHPKITIGFAAETTDLLANAKKKLLDKKLDMIIANDVTEPHAGFSVDTNKVTIITSNGAIDKLPLMSKAEVADVILQKIITEISTTIRQASEG